MATKYKLTYFNFYFRGEAIRQLLYLGGADFEEVTVDFTDMDKWNKLKSQMPFGQLPVLEFDGKKIGQSLTINRYLANKFGFAGKSEDDKVKAEMLSEYVLDLIIPLEAIFDEPDEKKKVDMTQNYTPKFVAGLENLQKHLDANKSKGGFFVGDSMTWVDILWTSYIPAIYFMKLGAAVDKFPKLLKIRDQVEATPRIKEWLSKRPKSLF